MTLNAERRRNLSAGTKKAMRRYAANRACPKCERKSAMRSIPGVGRECRWCGYYKSPAPDGGER